MAISLDTRHCRPTTARQSGFALVTVIWSLGLIALLGTAVIVGARYRTKVASAYASVTAGSVAAESAVALGIAAALSVTPDRRKLPLRCRLPGGERILVTLEEEVGKVDLNTASPDVLSRLFTALTGDQNAGQAIAGRIVQYRTPDPGRTGNQHPFTTILELDKIQGVSPSLFRTTLRFVTVRSGRPEPDNAVASPALRELLNLAAQPPGSARPPASDITIRADIRTADGTRFIREALLVLGENGRPYSIKEWRHGDIDPGRFATNRAASDDRLAECFNLGQAAAS